MRVEDIKRKLYPNQNLHIKKYIFIYKLSRSRSTANLIFVMEHPEIFKVFEISVSLLTTKVVDIAVLQNRSFAFLRQNFSFAKLVS